MRVLLMSFPTRTHVYSLAPLGWALRAAGHEVRYAGQRNPSEVEPFLETGLDAMWFGDDLDLALHRRFAAADQPMDAEYKLSESREERFTDDYVRTVYAMWAQSFRYFAPDSFLEQALAFARRWRPDLVVWDPMIYAGPLIAKAVGAVHVRMLYALDQPARLFAQHRALRRREPGPDPMVAWMSEWLGRHGLAFSDDLLLGMATIDPSPACIRYPLDIGYLPARFVPVNRPLPVPPWVLEKPGRPRVCLTLGVSNRQIHGREQASVTDLMDAVDGLDIEVIATLNPDQLTGARRVPPNVKAAGFVPMNELLPSCSAIVHQGGGATIGNAVVHGVPQLIVPGTTWSERASAVAQEKRGYGLFVDLEDITAERIRAALTRLLEEPSFKENAAQVRDEMLAAPPLTDIVSRLEAMTA
ncbi:nucleotide disphospho-sugar-binding domain-containing protein [Amycolatopsis sp. NPDC059021]|uniref:nucleotide disphospho-sugar-binding domain-containing protein n=1 Tax=Amycolatopsis sp. NPDC059021 TaxID=3346704 RepID=UPI003670F93C